MDARSVLEKIRILDAQIEYKKEEIESLWSQIVYTGAGTGEKVQATKNLHKKSDLICKYIELVQELENQINEMLEHKRFVMSLIDGLSNSEMIRIAYLKYFKFMSDIEIANEFGKTRQWVFALKNKLISEIESMLSKKKEHI